MASWAEDYYLSDWKPPKREKAAKSEWEAIRERMLTHATCVGCGFPSGLTLHHIVGKDRHGDDHEVNLVVLCMGPGTADCHGRFERHAQHWRRVAAAVRNYIYENEARLTYALGMLGQDLLDRTYPPLVEPCGRIVERAFNNRSQCDLPDGHPGDHAVLGDEIFHRKEKGAEKFGSDFENRGAEHVG